MINYHEVVKKLVGPIAPTGDRIQDEERLGNLREVINLVDRLMFDIDYVSREKSSREASVKKIGIEAAEFIEQIKEA